MTSFRETAAKLAPARLRPDKVARFVYSVLGLPLDGFAQAARDAARQSMVTLCAPDALPHHGRDRGMARAPNEPAQAYAERLVGWLDAWQMAGVGRSLLDQLSALLTPHDVHMRIITQNGLWYERKVGGEVIVERWPSIYDWDGETSLWARFWVVIYPPPSLWLPGPRWGDPDMFGGAWGTPGATWGTTAKSWEVKAVREVVGQWKPAFARCENIIIAFDPDSFSPSSADLPAGEYREMAADDGTGHWAPTRLASARYWDGV